MKPNKFSKLFLSALVTVSAGQLVTACSSGGGSSSPDATAPPVPTEGITGIWDGTMTWSTTGQQKDYTVTILFYMPDGEERGKTGGVAFGESATDIDDPHFLFEGGYEYFTDPVESDPQKDNDTVVCEGGVWAVGRFGTQGSFIQEFDYETGSAAGPLQRSAGCLYLQDANGDGYVNELVGEISFEEAGRFEIALTYSTDNTRTVTVSDLGTLASDEGTTDVQYHLWSNDNSGNFMSYTTGAITANTVDLMVEEDRSDTISCGGDVRATRIDGYNMFTLQSITNVDGCYIAQELGDYNVDLQYEGLGALYDLDGDGNLEFIHLMASRGSGEGYTAQALYNQFVIK